MRKIAASRDAGGRVHKPVMVREVVKLLVVAGNGTYVDGTLGMGGHARSILEQLGPGGRLVGIDRDEEALRAAERNLERWQDKCSFVRGNFAEILEICGKLNIRDVDGVLFDLGVSSAQLEDAERGFSFMRNGPLDMRMDRSQRLTAAELVLSSSEEELRELIRTFGEERFSGRIARAIVRQREKGRGQTTGWLADLICQVAGRRGGIHPATRTFQALRIAVNSELESLEEGLEGGLRLLKPGGRMVVISYHSLEDRIVKQVFGRHVGVNESLQAGGSRWSGALPRAAWVVRKPIMASEDELTGNPRARSAKLRVVERKQ